MRELDTEGDFDLTMQAQICMFEKFDALIRLLQSLKRMFAEKP
jgi:hypothetical protein